MARRALIFAGGSLYPAGRQARMLAGDWTWVIGADSGARHALDLGYALDCLVGDLDSIGPTDRRKIGDVPHLSVEADQEKTDTHIAVDWAVAQGARTIVIAGGIGTRFDHSLANVHLVVTLHDKGIQGVLTDGRQSIYPLADRLRIRGDEGESLSILPLTPRVEGLTLRGLQWELENRTISMGQTLTVSNRFSDDEAELVVTSGLALVVIGTVDD